MSEQRALLAATTERVLAVRDGEPFGRAWSQVAEAGLPLLMVPEDKGGFGGGWEDAFVVARGAGSHAVNLPLVEAILAARLVAEAELILPDGALTLAVQTTGRVRSGKFSGEMRWVPYGGAAQAVAGIVEDRGRVFLVVAECADAVARETRTSLAGEPRMGLQFEGANVQSAPLRAFGNEHLFHQFALMRSGQIAGALRAALALSVSYVRERQQFGKALASFQAIQQQLAVFAEETAAADAAASAAFRVADRNEALFEIACAKYRANRSAATAAGIAHQVHGAIGFTAEHSLHRFTRRLWAWRSEFGNERYWAMRLGTSVAERGADAFWPDLVDAH